jgi:hypothetical protein
MGMTEDFDDADDAMDAAERPTSMPRPAGTQWLVTRRRIEQAREIRELNKSLADFEDYVV